jgi:hypothetical protein
MPVGVSLRYGELLAILQEMTGVRKVFQHYRSKEIDFTATYRKYRKNTKINHPGKNDVGGVCRGMASSGDIFIVFGG